MKNIMIYSFLILLGTGCSKQNDFLDAKPNQSLVVPITLSDFQSLLNNTFVFTDPSDPSVGEIASDDFYVLPSVLTGRSPAERNAYTWAQNVFDPATTPGDWTQPYQQIYYANVVLDGLSAGKFSASDQAIYNLEKGEALFYRSYAFYQLLQVFALPYDAATAKNDPGIPLRLSSDITIKLQRAPVATCYAQLLNDLKTALPLLPVRSTSPTVPSQLVIQAFLARIYLSMSDYDDALTAATACLNDGAVLTDFNQLPIPAPTSDISGSFLSEDLYHSGLYNYIVIALPRFQVVDSTLYASYATDDLRKTKFFGTLAGQPQYPRFIGSYDYRGAKYDGLATDEIYLIRAECYARAGNTTAAMADLNTLLAARWLSGTFVPYTAGSADDALVQILKERRKELIFRGLRWTDLRRLNKDPRFAVTLTRNINGVICTLPPNDPRYVFPIPQTEIAVSGITQNLR